LEDISEDVSPGIVAGGPSSGAGLIWPLGGPVSSPYGAGHPLGIDIDAFHLGGAAVAAATSGTVLFAGGNACCSYGLYVVIMSDSGIETLYAHLDAIYVSQGQFVSQGEAIGVVGSTGYSTGVHLHFEVIDGGVRQNPLSYLP
jgi:murein DD-endopeptidase MepM/ murein hydrolase activator NlpD